MLIGNASDGDARRVTLQFTAMKQSCNLPEYRQYTLDMPGFTYAAEKVFLIEKNLNI